MIDPAALERAARTLRMMRHDPDAVEAAGVLVRLAEHYPTTGELAALDDAPAVAIARAPDLISLAAKLRRVFAPDPEGN